MLLYSCLTDFNVKISILYIGECVAGALYWKLFGEITKEIGFYGPYLVTSRELSCDNEELAKVLGV